MSRHCSYLSVCQGCHFDKMEYVQQLESKKSHLLSIFSEHQIPTAPIQIKSSGENYLRQRFDFTINDGRMGLYGAERNLIDIEECFQITPELQSAFTDFKKVKFPIKKGSVRIRVGPSGERGAWLDFANVDIKNLLIEKTHINQLWDLGFHIEIGQKGKVPMRAVPQYKLTDPEPHVWFQTLNKPLKCLISSFTQPSVVTADELTHVILNWLSLMKTPDKIAEFGSGIGQFTLPLLEKGFAVDAFESHALAAELLKLNAEENKLNSRLRIFCDDFQNKSISRDQIYDLAVVNPPRSGLLKFGDELVHVKTKTIIYISCFPESLAQDLEKLCSSGYRIKETIIVDQFPQTKHFETCVLLERINLNS